VPPVGACGRNAWRRFGAHKYHAQARLGTADGPTVAGLPRRARTVAYGGEADVAGWDVAHSHVPTRSSAKRFGIALFRRVFLKFLQQK
jgi:hypothetical protein